MPAEAVRSAPRVAQADRLSPEEEATLLGHYRSALAAPAHRTDTMAIPRLGTGGTTTSTDDDRHRTTTGTGTTSGTATTPGLRTTPP